MMINPQEHLVQSSSGVYTRKVWLLDAPDDRPTQIAIFLDGEYYVNRMAVPALIHEMQTSGRIPSLTCLFVSHVDGAARHQDLTCHTGYADFIARDVVHWLRERHPLLASDDHLLVGPSLGGLTSAFITLSYPHVFSRCLSHSGSFWWKDEWLSSNLDRMPASHSKFWLSVGDQETASSVSHPPTGLRQDVTQIAACERFAAALAARNHEVHFRTYQGGHDLQPWKDELPDALPWLLS